MSTLKDYIWFIYILLVIFAFLPFFRIDLYFKYKKYIKFLYINISLLIWTILMGLKLVLANEIFLYYASLIVYPIVFGLVVLLLLAIHDYLNIKNKKILSWTLFILWIVDAIAALTNNLHQAFIQLGLEDVITLSIFNNAPVGLMFYIHTIISYALLAYVFVRLFIHFLERFRKNKDFLPLFLITVCFTFGVIINIIHLTYVQFTIDPTLSVFLIFMVALYMIFIIRDLNLISQLNNNQFILDHYREMYLIVDVNGMVVNASDELKEKFELEDLTHKSFDEIKAIMNRKAIIYQDSKSISKAFQSDKIYLHMKEENINLPLFKYSGKLYLYYDETEHQALMHELNYVLYHDMMTDLYNRNYFEDYKRVLNHQNDTYGVLIFDLDGLKRTNDHFGHDAGDDMLKCFADSLKEVSSKHKHTTAIRLGGDEFVLIVEDSKDYDEKQIITHIESYVKKYNQGKCIGFSYGTAKRTDLEENISVVLKKADLALYEMKKKRQK